MAVRCAILDDYQNVVLKVADWSKVKGDVEFKVFNEHLGGPDKVIAALQGFQIVVAMRERTGFPKKVIDALPDLKLLIPRVCAMPRSIPRRRRRAASPSAVPPRSAARPPAS